MKKINIFFTLALFLVALSVISCSGGDSNNNEKGDGGSKKSSWTPIDYSTHNGTGTLVAKLWLDSTVPTALDKDAAGNMNVGWKDYNCYWKGNLIGSLGTEKTDKGGKSKSKYAGTITKDVYNAEYADRDQILNRVYNKSTGIYEADTNVWDLSSLKAEFGISE